MLIYGYMMRMAPIVPKLSEISEDMLNLLSLFVFNHHLSIYQIHKIMKEARIKIAYKNAHKKVQRLADLNLIERVADNSKFNARELERGAKYYKLSEEGIFVLFHDSKILFNPNNYYLAKVIRHRGSFDETEISRDIKEYRKEIFKKHKDCNFFELFLTPWISISTIENLDERTIDKVGDFLTDCCSIVKSRILFLDNGIYHNYPGFSGIQSSDNPKWQYNYADLNSLNDGIVAVDSNPLLSLVNKIFTLGAEEIKVQRPHQNRITISKKDDTKLAQLIYKEEEGEEKGMDIISANDPADRVLLPAKSTREVLLPNPLFDYVINQIDLTSLYFKAVFSVMIENIKDNDLHLLKDDARFKKTALDLNDRVRTTCEVLIR